MKSKILEAYIKYIEGTKPQKDGTFSQHYGSKDSVSVNVMHNAIANELNEIAEEAGLQIRTNEYGGEFKLTTEIHTKRIDISIVDPSMGEYGLVVAISFKMPLSSVSRNLSTMNEGNIGDTALIKDSGVPMYYVMFTDKNPVTKKRDLFQMESLGNGLSQMFSKKMKIPRTNKYRSDGIFIAVVDFKDIEIKKKFLNQPFAKEGERKILAEQHIKYLKDNVNAEDLEISVLQNDGTFTETFEEEWEMFKSLMKLEIELYKIRKNHF